VIVQKPKDNTILFLMMSMCSGAITSIDNDGIYRVGRAFIKEGTPEYKEVMIFLKTCEDIRL